jgi:drug/metabolite transporter (DMT)-like permease
VSALSTRRTAYLAWVIVCLAWGTTYLAIRIALESIPPALVGGLRFTAAGTLLALALAIRGELTVARQSLPGQAMLGLLMIAIGNGSVIWAEQWVPSGFAALLVATTPLWLNGLEPWLKGGQPPSRAVVIGLLVGFTGIAVLTWPDLRVGGISGRQFMLGVIALQVSSLAWSIGTLYSRRHAPAGGALSAAAIQMIVGGGIMLGIATVRGEWSELSFTSRTWAAECYLTVMGSLVAYPAYLFALKHLSLPMVSVYSYVNPLIAVCLGALVVGEPFGWRVGLSAALVLGGVLICRSAATRGVAFRVTAALLVTLLVPPVSVAAQESIAAEDQEPADGRVETSVKFLAGAALGLAIHEGSHLLFNVTFDAAPGLKGVSYAGIPFFAITHEPVSAVKEFTISSAGFWAQHASSELILSMRPRLRQEHAPVLKGLLAFNVLASAIYAGAAIARTGPPERDTRGMAVSAGIAEPWIAAVILTPAAMDTMRYLRPESRTARWISRAAKVGGVLLVIKARR